MRLNKGTTVVTTRERILEGELGKEKLDHSREIALKAQEVELWKSKMSEAHKEKEGIVARY